MTWPRPSTGIWQPGSLGNLHWKAELEYEQWRYRKRFIEKVEEDGTHWLWTGAKTPAGYGLFVSGPRGSLVHEVAHRVSFRLFVGPLLNEDIVDHICRIKLCVAPWDLRIASHKENARNRRTAKVDEEMVREIRRLAGDGQTYKAIAERFSLSDTHVSMIVRRLVWEDA